jgi:uncharacterized iron-regulated membrane protein
VGPTIRQSMNMLHTWVGLIVGALLFAIFWMGTLSVFDREIDRWMEPMTRLAKPATMLPFETFRSSYNDAAAGKAASWTLLQPTERQPVYRVVYRDAAGLKNLYFDPVTGAPLPRHETLAGSQFLYPFHYHLHLRAWDVGEWLVGFAAMAMLVLCISGVIFHRKLFADFFTFRPSKQASRMVLDMHTLTGVLGFPFHVVIVLSGLIVHFATYFPSGWAPLYASERAFNMDATDTYSRPKANRPGSLASMDAMADEAQRLWNGGEPWAIVVRHPGDAAAFATVFQSFDLGIKRQSPAVYFDAATGTVLHQSENKKPVLSTQRFISGLHQIQFRHWTLRFAYFVLGGIGCILIATGFLFWLESRRKRHAQLGLPGVRIVEGLAVGGVAGIIAATAAFLVINRVLPLGTTFLGVGRAGLEIWTFYLVWLATFAWAWLFPRSAWTGSCKLIAALALSAVALNWVTTGDHLARSLTHPHLWGVAGVDLMLMASATVAVLLVRWLQNAETRGRAVTTALAT